MIIESTSGRKSSDNEKMKEYYHKNKDKKKTW